MKQFEKYWKTNLKYLVILLSFWFVLGLVFPVLIVDNLNAYRLAGFPLGFWFGMQGTQISFVILIFIYVYLMNRLDNKYDIDK
ncbi:DUF4212 domain-containing protein [Aquimarina megaterium]|uniref:DUF4212 domain-containing protein n=1 Tax=Aquimarina megaterium TaxID=1443666 RepID=UPI0009432DE6|nr:DUF4212 domain-containing protein [Aquimarina megaterium]